MKFKADVYDRVTNLIIQRLEHAIAARESGKKWQRPWVNVAGYGQPVSITGTNYRGMNYVLLSMLSGIYPSQLFGTYKGWSKRGAQVRRGEKSNLVVFYKPMEKEDKKTKEKKKFLFMRYYYVFAAEQVDGFDLDSYMKSKEQSLPDKAERISHADEIAQAYVDGQNLDVKYGGNKACYIPSIDSVRMPSKKQFKSTEDLYSTLFHEFVHSTGHEKRLNRDFQNRFGSEAYAFEELVAEIGASMICNGLGIENEMREDHTDYLAHWLKVLKDDKKAIFTAAAAAQLACDMIVNSKEDDEESEEELEEAA